MDDVKELLRIVGNEDGVGGEPGTFIVTGHLANCIIKELGVDHRSPLHGTIWEHPVRVIRSGSLEIWVNGWYAEGSGIHKIIRNAVRRHEKEYPYPYQEMIH